MNKTIYKYKLEVAGNQRLTLPSDHRILDLQIQYNTLCLWVEVDLDSDPTTLSILTFGTGHALPPRGIDYIGSYQLQGGAFVGHVYKEVKV